MKHTALDAIVHINLLYALEAKPDLARRLTNEDDTIGKVVDVVPHNGNIVCMASRAATAIILKNHQQKALLEYNH